MAKARVIVMFLILAFMACPVFAAEEATQPTTRLGSEVRIDGVFTRNPFSLPLSFFESIIISSASGALVASKFIIDIIRAYLSSEHEAEAIKKAVIRFLTVLFVVFFFTLTLMYITGLTLTPRSTYGGGYFGY